MPVVPRYLWSLGVIMVNKIIFCHDNVCVTFNSIYRRSNHKTWYKGTNIWYGIHNAVPLFARGDNTQFFSNDALMSFTDYVAFIMP